MDWYAANRKVGIVAGECKKMSLAFWIIKRFAKVAPGKIAIRIHKKLYPILPHSAALRHQLSGSTYG
jgi:hypothetical protein